MYVMYVCYVCMYVVTYIYIYITHFISKIIWNIQFYKPNQRKGVKNHENHLKWPKKAAPRCFSKTPKSTKFHYVFPLKLPNPKLYKPLSALKFPSVEWGRLCWKRLKVVRRDPIDLQIIYIYIYIYTHIHTHTHIYIYIYVCVSMCISISKNI